MVVKLQGIWGAVFVKFNIRWCRYRKKHRLHKYPILEVFYGIKLYLVFW